MLAQFVFSQSCLSALALGVFGSFRWVSKMRETKNIMEYEIELRKLLNEKNLISKLTITWWEKTVKMMILKVASSFHQSRSKLSFFSLQVCVYDHKIKSHQIRYRETKKWNCTVSQITAFFIWYNYLKSKCILWKWFCKEKLCWRFP